MQNKRIMLHFLLLPDFQEDRPRCVHKMRTLEVDKTLKAASEEVNLDWLELKGLGERQIFLFVPFGSSQHRLSIPTLVILTRL